MARISGIDIPKEKKVPYSLCYIHGIGFTTAKEICNIAKIDLDLRVKDLSDNQVASVREAITNMDLRVEGERRTEVSMNIKRKRISTIRSNRKRKRRRTKRRNRKRKK